MAETVYSTPTYSRVSRPTVGSREISSDRVGDHGEVLTLDGRCDLSTALQADQWIVSALDAGTSELIFDLRGVTSLDPAMLHMLFRGLIRIKGQKGQLTLIRPNSYVWSLFEQSGLDRGFSSCSDLKGALAESTFRRISAGWNGSHH